MLIDFFKSYLLAGLLLPYATKSVLKQRQWCSPIHTSLTIICQAYAQGKNFKEGIQLGIQNSKQKKSRQYLSLLFLTLRLGCSTGENLTLLLEKVKTKTQDRLHLERKLRMTTAQMRLQSFVIICSPLFLSLILYIMSPNYILFFFNNIIGNFLLIIMIILNFLGAISIKKILRIK